MRLETKLINGIHYRQCVDCGDLTPFVKKKARCPRCQYKKDHVYDKNKRRRNNEYIPSRKSGEINSRDFEDRHIKGLWSTVENPKLRKAMREGDFKEFMKHSTIRQMV